MTTSIKGGIPVGGNLAFRDLVYRPQVDGAPQMMPLPYYGDPGEVMNLARDPSFRINAPSPFKNMPQSELDRLKDWDSDPGALQEYYNRINLPGPKLFPQASVMGNMGNVAGMLPGDIGAKYVY
jgi:hypothetical protein